MLLASLTFAENIIKITVQQRSAFATENWEISGLDSWSKLTVVFVCIFANIHVDIRSSWSPGLWLPSPSAVLTTPTQGTKSCRRWCALPAYRKRICIDPAEQKIMTHWMSSGIHCIRECRVMVVLLTTFSMSPFLDCRNFFKYPNTWKQSSSSANSIFVSMAKYTPDLPPPSLINWHSGADGADGNKKRK